MESEARDDILRRLRTTEGHLRAVIDMTEKGMPCEEVLHQLHALQAALRVVTTRMILCQIESSQAAILDDSSAGRREAEIKRLQSLCTLFMHNSRYPNEVFNE